MPDEWRLKSGLEPIPGIGDGPFAPGEFENLWAAYLSQGGWSEYDGPVGGDVYVRAGESDIAAAEGPTPASPDAAASLDEEVQE